MIPRTEVELRELASYIFENKVFGSWSFSSENQARNCMHVVFMPLMFMPQDERDAYREEGVIHFYEFYDKAGPRSINGCPIFSSVRFLLKDEWETINLFLDKLVKQRKEFMGEEVPDGEVNWHQPMR
jgi:hypothetical protein